MVNVEALINNYQSKHKEGFIIEEIDHIINHNFPDIDISKFDEELVGSAIEVEDGDWINIKSDVLKALKISKSI
tara:strand:- start:34 stop:255 length:222 start_codon:yes stop_codon:yes gene_type:complete